MRRRQVLKTIVTVAGASVASTNVNGQEAPGPFSLPSAKFSAEKQHKYPSDAFKRKFDYPLVPRPTAIGTFEELHGKAVFGPGDNVPLGSCFHGIASEWAETPEHWSVYGMTPGKSPIESWIDKQKYFGEVKNHVGGPAISNWGGLKIKCYKIPIVEGFHQFNGTGPKTRVYTYGGRVPGPTLKMRLCQPVVVRYENHIEAEMSIHLHGGHSPSHSDGFPSFYVLQGKARDYFYPNMLPMIECEGTEQACDKVKEVKVDGKLVRYRPDEGEAQSTMWYHDHAMDATAYNVSKGLAGFAPCFGERELELIANRVLPGLGSASCEDSEMDELHLNADGLPDPSFEDDSSPGFYKHELGKEPYFNPYDIPLALQDKVFDERTGQIAYDNTGHNGFIGDTFLVNGIKMVVKIATRTQG